MEKMGRLNELREQGGMMWAGGELGWIAEPEQILNALLDEGFQEYKREIAGSRRNRRVTGGVWEGLNPRTGSVASAIWVKREGKNRALVFIDIDGEPLKDA